MTQVDQNFIIERRKLSEQVARYLEAEIIEGRYPAGAKLPSERELMDQLHVGRPSIREALFALQNKGLVAINSGSRARVIVPDPEALLSHLDSPIRYLLSDPEAQRHFQGLRAFFEIGLVRAAAAQATEDDLDRIRQALERNAAALASEDMAEFQRTDIEFHYSIAEVSRNPIFLVLHNAVADWLTEQRQITLQVPGQARIAYGAHAFIADAIASRDPSQAEQAMAAHLDQLHDVYWAVKEQAEGSSRDDC